jgi:ribonuclease HIII
MVNVLVNQEVLNFVKELKVDFSKELPNHFIKKIRDDEDIVYVPYLLKKEQYNFSLEEDIANSFKTTENLKILSSIFNHYIWIYKKLFLEV